MNRRFISRILMALALMFTLGLVTIAAAPKASAHALTSTCGNFTTSSNKTSIVINGSTVGYVESLNDACGKYELHSHLSMIPTGVASGPYHTSLEQGDGIVFSASFTTAPQDLYLPQTRAGQGISSFLFSNGNYYSDGNYIYQLLF